MALRVLIGGPVNSGKSTLACSLYVALSMQGVPSSLVELDIWSDTHTCILGERPWRLRKKKISFSSHKLKLMSKKFLKSSETVVIGDLPGKIDRHTKNIATMAQCVAILIKRRRYFLNDFKYGSPEEWEKFFQENQIPLLAKVHSLLPSQRCNKNYIPIADLDRALVPFNPGVQSLVSLLKANL